ncbi:MAG: hypothetical protein Q9183_003521, partial [Haloplaca sp. 2 TL-2023]
SFTMWPSTNNEPRVNNNQLPTATIPESTHPLPSPLNGEISHQNGSAPPIPSPRAVRRTPSSTSVGTNERTVTPVLHKRSSYSSIHGTNANATPPRSPALRRTSSNISLNQPSMAPRSSLPAPAEEPEKPPKTAASVAQEYFMRELEVHAEGPGADRSHNTVVILQDDCYGHRYSRPRTSRASLGTIVERPERIHASMLGAATAYVRAGGRHVNSHTGPHPKRKVGLMASMPFRIQNTDRRVSLTSLAATSVHGTKWMSDLKIMCDAAESKLAMTGKELARPQSTDQTTEKNPSDRSKLHEGDLYLCSGSLEALEGSIGGVCEAVDAVFRDSGPNRAFVCIRPPGHHCSADMPSGFCWINNIHIGINYAIKTYDLTHAAIIDFDLHHGDGSQSIAWAHNAKVASMPKNAPQSKRTAIGYFSLHDINSYPCEDGDEDKVRNASLCLENAHGQTIWNVHLQPWKTEKEFWDLYQDRYAVVLAKTRSFLRFHTDRLKQAPLHPRPKAAIFLSAGFDASEWESPGMQRHQVNVPTDFYARFTRDVLAIADEEGLGVDGRVISVLEGGYSDRALMSGVLSHLSGLTAEEDTQTVPIRPNGLGHEMSQRLGKLEINGHARHGSGNVRQPPEPLDPGWWSLPQLEEMEKLVNPPAPAAPPKKVKSAVPTSYSSTTQSYVAKIVSPPQNRRSMSGSVATYPSPVTSSPRAPSPPPPPVDWATAAHELSKLLVPSDRQTRSCKPEDLNAEATRVRRDRQSNIGLPMEVPPNDGKRMQLRDRKAKPPKYASDEELERPMSRANRRKTIADVAALPQDEDGVPPMPPAGDPKKGVKPKARRSSMASSVSSVSGEKPPLSRLGSSSGIPPSQDTVAAKKNRVPTSSRPEPAKSRPVKSKPSVPPAPSTLTVPEKAAPDPSSRKNASEALSQNDDLQNQDVDQLASNMKKMSIKLNVPSKDEQKIREAKRAQAAPRGRPKSTTTKPSAAMGRTQKPAAKQVNPTENPPLETATEKEKINIENLIHPEQNPTDPLLHPAPEHTVVEGRNEQQPPSQPAPPPPSDPAPSSFLPPEAPAISATAPLSQDFGTQQIMQPLTSHPPQDTKPSYMPIQRNEPLVPTTPKHSKHNLPIFTSTSPIVFGGQNAVPTGMDQMMQAPTQEGPDDEMSGKGGVGGGLQNVSTAPGEQGPLSPSRKVQQEKDIFDVPDSPEQFRRRGGGHGS